MTPVRLEPGPRGGGGGGTPIFSYIRRLRSFLGFKILNFNIFFFWGGGGFRILFWGEGVYEDFVDIFCGVITNWTIFSGYFNAF